MGSPQSKPNKEKPNTRRSRRRWYQIRKKGGLPGTPSTPPNSKSQTQEPVPKMDFDQYVINAMRNQIAGNIPPFICNQIMLSVQFFRNYEREKLQAMERMNNLEKKINEKLNKHYIMLPNVLDDAVDKCVKFQLKPIYEQQPLQLQTMYVVYKDIEILKLADADYECISQFKFILDSGECDLTEKFDQYMKGFVKLKSWEIASKNELARKEKEKRRAEKYAKKFSTVTLSSEESLTDEEEDDGVELDQTYSNPSSSRTTVIYQANQSRRPSTTSTAYFSYSEYDYAYVTKLNTHQPLNTVANDHLEQNIHPDQSEIPESCMTPISAVLGNVSLRKGCEYYHYFKPNEMKFLDSRAFWNLFANTLRVQLAPELGISNEDLDGATFKGASIYTSSYEIIPALHYATWPICALDWITRFRKEHINPHTYKKVRWPNKLMIERVTSFGCNLVPIGYAPKHGKNACRELEWKIVFPKAEQFLESCLTSAQAKIFMISKALIKSFVEPEQNGRTYMFSIDHLRAHLFWECENNYLAWPEEFLGEKLINFLKSFLQRLKACELPDYFVSKRNLFEHVPMKTLSDLHSIISRIVHNPAIYVMAACKNLSHMKDFFPKLKYTSLYSALTVEHSIHLFSLKTSAIRNYSFKEIQQINPKIANEDDFDINDTNEQNVGRIQKERRKDERRKTKIMLRNKNKQKMDRQSKHLLRPIDLNFLLPETLESIRREGVDMDVIRRKPIEDLRRIFIIELFAKFYIVMAYKSNHDYGNLLQTAIYLHQANRLCILLKEYNDYLRASDLIDKINYQWSLYKDSSKNSGALDKRSESDQYISIDKEEQKRKESVVVFKPTSFDTKVEVHTNLEPSAWPIVNVNEGKPKPKTQLNGVVQTIDRAEPNTWNFSFVDKKSISSTPEGIKDNNNTTIKCNGDIDEHLKNEDNLSINTPEAYNPVIIHNNSNENQNNIYHVDDNDTKQIIDSSDDFGTFQENKKKIESQLFASFELRKLKFNSANDSQTKMPKKSVKFNHVSFNGDCHSETSEDSEDEEEVTQL